MAPEQAAGHTKNLTAAADIYALGALFYQMLTGQPPFAGGTTYETVRLVLDTEPRQPRPLNPKVDRDLSTICLKCLEKDPKRRYPSAVTLAEDLEHWLKHEPIKARSAGMFSRRRRKWLRRNRRLAHCSSDRVVAHPGGMMMEGRASSAVPTTGIAVLPFENLSNDRERLVR